MHQYTRFSSVEQQLARHVLHTILPAFGRRNCYASPATPVSSAFAQNRIGRSARYRPLNNMGNAAAPLTPQVLTERPRVAPVNRATHFAERRIETRLVRSGHTSAPRSFAGSRAPIATVTSNLVTAAWPRFRTRSGLGLPLRFLAHEP
jgi:hypothetical protein